MSAPKLTPWFPGNIKPVRPGVYETKWIYETGGSASSAGGFSRWTGSRWMDTGPDVEFAARIITTGYHSKQWRGLAEPPK
jgi:hypothetical protein